MGAFAEGVSQSEVRRHAAVIVAMVGTGPDSFHRLVRPLDELAAKNSLDVFVQLGHTSYKPKYCRFERFVERDRLLKIIEQAEIVITQGGYGSIRDALLFNRPLVAVPRYPALNESPDHQDELVRAMEQCGYLIGVYDIEQLESAIQMAREFVPRERIPSAIPAMLCEYVRETFFN